LRMRPQSTSCNFSLVASSMASCTGELKNPMTSRRATLGKGNYWNATTQNNAMESDAKQPQSLRGGT
jgi:hypothetical protein